MQWGNTKRQDIQNLGGVPVNINNILILVL